MPKNATPQTRYVVEEIPLALIDYTEQQIRDVQVDDEIHELASSIDALDLLQFPGVIQKADGRYALCWGRRRLEAFRLRQKATIPCRIYQGDPEAVKALALVENLQRRSMSVKEECDAVAYLAEVKKLPIDTIVQQLGRTRSWVLTRLAVPNFPAPIREALLHGDVGLGTAEAIARCENESDARYILSQAVHAKLTLAEVRSLVEAASRLPQQDEAIQAGLDAARESIAPSPIYFECAACNTPRPPQDLTFVRICKHGCRATSDTLATEGD